MACAGTLDRKACQGKGACVSSSGCAFQLLAFQSTNEPAYNCGAAGIVNMQEEASAKINFRSALSTGTQVSKADFPECDLAQPGPDSVLLVCITTRICFISFIPPRCAFYDLARGVVGLAYRTPDSSGTISIQMVANYMLGGA